MKLAVGCLFAFIAIVYVSAAPTAEMLKKIHAAAEVCKPKTGVTDEDIAVLKKHEVPETQTGQCFVACMNKEFGIMTADNKIDIEHIKEMTTHLQEKNPEKYEKGQKVLETCAAEVAAESDECAAAKKMMDCCKKEAAAHGLKLSDLFEED